MCTKRDIDDILKQLAESQDPDYRRRILDEANLCKKCSENLQGHGEQESDCCCRQHFRTELQNYSYSITHQEK